ncbi:MAG: DNA-binding protein [Acidobacteriia bacterium]|nr:DNA-binding protein [Terriglobia bacterium]
MKTTNRERWLLFLLLAGVLCAAGASRLNNIGTGPSRLFAMCVNEPAASSAAPAGSTSENETAASAVHTVSSRFSRVVVVRLRNDADLLEGLKTAVAREKIKNAVILSGAGSLTSYHVHVVSNTVFPPTNAFFKGTGPYDLLTTTGYIIDGRVHAHISFSDTQKTLGGHLEPGTRVFTFAILTLGVLEEPASLDRFDDYTWR